MICCTVKVHIRHCYEASYLPDFHQTTEAIRNSYREVLRHHHDNGLVNVSQQTFSFLNGLVNVSLQTFSLSVENRTYDTLT